jgi:hypothetical protein
MLHPCLTYLNEDSMHKNHHREMKNYRQTIQATPDQVFPLLCPVREKEWLENWQYQMLYSESGLAETGAVFATTEGTEQAIRNIGSINSVRRSTDYGNSSGLLSIYYRTTPSCRKHVA